MRLILPALTLAACLVGLVLLLSAGVPPAGAHPALLPGPPQWGPDVQVNPLVTLTPSTQKNFSMAVNPTDPNKVIASYNTSSPGGGQSGYSASTDGGRTWRGGVFNGPWGSTEPMTPLGDTNVVFDATGTGYYSSVAIGNTTHGYFILTTTNGLQWGTPVPIAVTDYSQSRSQTSLAVDPRATGPFAGSLYLFGLLTTSTSPFVDGIQMRYSRDGGSTWSGDVRVSDPPNKYSYSPQARVASDGTVYVAFEQLDDYNIFNAPRLYLDRSTDAGVTWGTDRLVSGAPITSMGRPDFKDRELTLIGGATCSLMRVNHFPSIAVSPNDPNTVYVVWNDGRWEEQTQLCGRPGRHSDIAFSRTTDAGLTWSPVSRLNDDPLGNGVDQFQPTISVRPDGLLGVTWHDRRYDPNGYLFDIAYTQSSDGGLTWSQNQRVSDLSSDPDKLTDFKSIDDVGYRNALAFGPDYVLPSWIDTRLGTRQGDFFTDRGLFLADTPTPTSSPTSSLTSTRTSTPTVTATAPPTNTTTNTPTGLPTNTPTFTPTGTRQPTDTPTRTPANSPTNTPSLTPTGTRPPTGTPTATPTATPTGTPPPAGTPTNTPTPSHAVTVTPTATLCQVTFSDVQTSDYFYQPVRYLYCRGVISGYSDGTFKPYNLTTRGQLAKIVVLAQGWTIYTPPTPTFSDVPTSNAFYGYIETAYQRGIISGYTCGGVPSAPCLEYRPGSNVTRGQLCKIVALAQGWTIYTPPAPTFTDVPASNAFYGYIETAYSHGIISGYTCGAGCLEFRPAGSATRGQICKIVYLALGAP